MAWDDKPATEISYPPYSPSPSEIEAHRTKNARIEAWTKALPEPHPGSGASVGAHSAQWSDRAPSNASGPSASRDPRYAHPFAAAGPGVRPPPPQLEIHRRPPRGTPVAPLLAQSPSHDYAADYELPRADHLVNPVHGGPTGGPGTMRSRREAYFAAALDLPLDMITEALPNNLERELHMYQHPQQWEAPQQQLHPSDEKRGGFRSLLGRSKSQVSLKHSGPPSASSSERSARGISLDPAAAAGTAGTLSKMRSMDAKLLQRASMSGSMNPVTGNGTQGMQEGAWRNTHGPVPAPGPGPSGLNNPPSMARNGSLARSKSQIHTAHAGPSAPPVSFRNDPAPAENGEPVVQLTRRTSSRGALGHKPVRGQSRTPSPHHPDATQQTPAAAPVVPVATPGVLTNNNGPRANGNAIGAVETRTSDHKKENAPVKETHTREARAPVLPSKAGPVKPLEAQTRTASKAPPALPTVVVTTPPNEGSKRVKASVTKGSKTNTSAGLPKRTSSISRAQKPSRSTSSPALASASLPSAPAPATHPAPPAPQSKSQPPSPSRASAHSPGPAQKKSVPAPTKENKRSEPVGEASKRQSKSRVFSWLPSRKAAEGKENKTKAPASQSSRRKDDLGQSQPAVVAAGGAATGQSAQRSAAQPVLHGQSKQPSNLSHHQPPAPAPETHVHHAETTMQPPLASESEQRFYTPPLNLPEQTRVQQQNVGVPPSGYEWIPQQQPPMATGQLPPGAMPMAPAPAPQPAQYGVQQGYPPQPDPYAYAGQPLPEIPAHPAHPPMTMRPPTAPAYPAIPQATGTVPPPAEAARRWLPPMFNGPSAERGDERQKRMSTHEDNTNLKKQVSSTGTATEDGTMYRTDPTSVVSMSLVSGNISHSASLADGMKLNTLDMSKVQERLATGTTTASAASPISPLDPQGISTPAKDGPVTPPRSATQITLGSGFTPLRVSDLFGGAGSESDGMPMMRSVSGNSASGKIADSNAAPNGEKGGSDGASSAAPSDDTRKNACAPGTPSKDASSPSSSSATGETGAAALTPSKFDLRGKSWSETERSCHESTPSVSEPIAIELPRLPQLPPRPPPPPPKDEVDVPDIGPDWLELGPEYGLEGQVYLHHCGSLRVLERVVEEDEEAPVPKPKPVAPKVVWQADPTAPPPPQRTGRPRRGSGSAQPSPRSGERAMPRVSPTQVRSMGPDHPFDRLPDMDEMMAGAGPSPAGAVAAEVGPLGALGLSLGPAITLNTNDTSGTSGSTAFSGSAEAEMTTGEAHSTPSPARRPPQVIVIGAETEGGESGARTGQNIPRST